MRRDTFLKSLAALAAAGTLPLTAHAAANIKMMIPANPGGGWDATGRALGVADHGAMVWDEVVAFALVLVFTPDGWLWQAGAFLLFRLFDILKPPPIHYFDRRLKSGFGVMFDDLLAAFYTLLVLALIKLLTDG